MMPDVFVMTCGPTEFRVLRARAGSEEVISTIPNPGGKIDRGNVIRRFRQGLVVLSVYDLSRAPFFRSYDGGRTLTRVPSLPGTGPVPPYGRRIHDDGTISVVDNPARAVWILRAASSDWMKMELPPTFRASDVAFDGEGAILLVGDLFASPGYDFGTPSRPAMMRCKYGRYELLRPNVKGGSLEDFLNDHHMSLDRFSLHGSLLTMTADAIDVMYDQRSAILCGDVGEALLGAWQLRARLLRGKDTPYVVVPQGNHINLYTAHFARHEFDRSLSRSRRTVLGRSWMRGERGRKEYPHVGAVDADGERLTVLINSSHAYRMSRDFKVEGQHILVSTDHGETLHELHVSLRPFELITDVKLAR